MIFYHPSNSRRLPQGFTLLEMMVVMFVLTLLLGAIFGVVRGTIQLTDEMTIEQNKEAKLHGFAQFCERTFRNLPAQSMTRLRVKQEGNRYLSQLAFKDTPAVFSGQSAGGEGLMILETEEAPGGYLQVVLRMMNREEALAWEQGDSRMGTRLILLENVASLEWKMFNPKSDQWEPVWNERDSFYPLVVLNKNVPETGDAIPAQQAVTPARPTLVALELALGNDSTQRWTFWAPPSKPVENGVAKPLKPVVVEPE